MIQQQANGESERLAQPFVLHRESPVNGWRMFPREKFHPFPRSAARTTQQRLIPNNAVTCWLG